MFSAPLADHEFLNLRTYVRCGDEVGIYFIAEWIPNRLAILVGPGLYGLPYRFGRLRYTSGGGEVAAGTNRFAYRIGETARADAALRPAGKGSMDEFLLERYSAFTHHQGVGRRFRIMHQPWLQAPVDVRIDACGLPTQAAPWFEQATFIGANFSPGVCDVQIGRPELL